MRAPRGGSGAGCFRAGDPGAQGGARERSARLADHDRQGAGGGPPAPCCAGVCLPGVSGHGAGSLCAVSRDAGRATAIVDAAGPLAGWPAPQGAIGLPAVAAGWPDLSRNRPTPGRVLEFRPPGHGARAVRVLRGGL
ncbi:hypothetical protein G6F24_017336 [Rhizopus arrhizus]|nr:hypothetical protein G6F24_017336 [Rhizopus arrhizus]